MMTRSVRSGETDLMAISLPDARDLSDEVLEALRLRALRGCELDFTETEVADLLGVCRETVCHWWSAYVDGDLSRVLMPGRSFYVWGGYANCANYPPVLKACGLYFSQAQRLFSCKVIAESANGLKEGKKTPILRNTN
jgi:hypothetical protein